METVICPTCKFENPAAAKFCMNCGEPFQAAPPPSAATTRKLEAEPTPKDTSTVRLPADQVEAAAKSARPDWLEQLHREVEQAKQAEPVRQDFSTVRLSPEELAQAAPPPKDASTVRLSADDLAKAAAEIKPEEPPRDFSTVKLSADELAKAVEAPPVGEPPKDFSTVKLSADELAKAVAAPQAAEPPKDFSTVKLNAEELKKAVKDAQPAETASTGMVPPFPKRYCPNCGREVKPGIKFCDDCGSRIDSAPGGAPPAPPVIPTPPISQPPEAVPEEPPAKPAKRRRKTGCIIGVILLCLLVVAATVTAVVYLDEIKALLGFATATPVAQVEPSVERPTATPRPPDTETPTPTQTYTPTSTLTPTATPVPPRTLTICIGSEPDSLYLYGSSMLSQKHILQAVYDGPFDQYAYDYHAVILEKMPSLADGDAVIASTSVQAGDWVVNNDDTVVALSNGERVRPAGCRSSDCAITYSGGSIQMDVMSVTFSLLPGLTWSDGTPLTAYDSEFSYYLDSDPDSVTSKYVIERTAYYAAVDDLTAQWEGLPGYLDTTYYINFWTPLPEHVLGGYSAAVMAYVEPEELLLGWGPYIFDEYTPGVEITFVRNPNYFRAAEGLPVFSDLVIRFIGTDSNQAVSALLAGECDVLDREIPLLDQGQTLLDLESSGALDAVLWSNQTWEHADFNIRPVDSIINSGAFAGWDQDRDGQGPFGDVRLRQAIALCMDRQAVNDAIYLGAAAIMDTLIPPDHPLIAPDLPVWPYDPSAGQALLDEIGWIDADGDPYTPRIAQNVTGVPNRTQLTFFYETTTAQQRQQALQILAETLTQCGIGVNVVHWPAGEWFADGPDGRLFGRQFDLGQFAWIITGGMSCDLYMSNRIPSDQLGWGGQNETGYSNPDFDAACSRYYQTLPGETGYVENSWDVQYYLAWDLPTIPLYTRVNINATRSDFCHLIPASTINSEMWNLEAFNYGDTCP